MKTVFRVLILFLLSVPSLAQLQTFKGDTAATTSSTRANYGMSFDGRGGQKLNTGNFRKFAFLDEVAAAVAGGVVSVNTKSGAVSLSTTDIPEAVNLYYTQARARSAISATGPIVYNNTTGAFTFSGTPADVQLGNVNNTSDANKPISTAQQNALDLKANQASSIYTVTVANYAALTAYTVPANQVYLVKVTSDESQAAPYNTNQYYLKDSAGVTFKFSLIKQ